MELKAPSPRRVLKASIPPRRRFSISSRVLSGLVVGLDSVAILSSGFIAYLIFAGDPTETANFYASAGCFVWLSTILFMNFAGLYKFEPIMRPLAFSDKFVIAFATTFLFLIAAVFSLKISATFSRIWIGSFAAGACAATLSFRLLASLVLERLEEMQVFTRNVVIAGGGEQTKALLAYIEKLQPRFISVLGIFVERPGDAVTRFGRYPILGGLDGLAKYAQNNKVDDVILALPWSADEQITAIVRKLRELPLNVYLCSDLVGFRLALREAPGHFGEMPLVEVMGRPLSGWDTSWKALEDYVLGAILTLLLLPLMALIAIAIKFDSAGPVLFRQRRSGFVGKGYNIYKFRTMRHVDHSEKKTQQATRNDPRITRLGRFLRRTSLDELPQLFNVLNGTMSLVGPRPHAVDHNEAYSQEIRGYFARLRVKPGITGWAQVNGLRGETKTVDKMEARVKLDIYYVENWSLLFDLRILLMTAFIMLTSRNAY